MKGLCGVFALAILSVSAQEVAPDKIIPYKKINNIELTLHLFSPPRYKSFDKRAAIVFFFGGGWQDGAPSQFYRQSRYLASRGMVAFCAEYRTEFKHGTAPTACVKDGKSAVRWIRDHAAELGIDPCRIAAGGGSAGGHIAAATALIDAFCEDGESQDINCQPNALVLYNPVFDNGPTGYGYYRVADYWRDFSPIEHIDPEAPPTLIMLGTKDHLIPINTARRYKENMVRVGVRCELCLYEGQPHGFFNEAKYRETLIEVDHFLESLGYLNGPPTLPCGN